MKDKKNEKYDLNKLRWLIYTIGLVVTLSVILTAFESFGYYDKNDKPNILAQDIEPEETLIIPPTELTIPPSPPPQNPEVKEVANDEVIDDLENFLDVEPNENLTPPKPVSPAPPANTGIRPPKMKQPEKVVDEPFLMAEKQPEFPGGTRKFAKYLRKNLKYPPQARRMGIEGKVFVEFVVNRDGSLVDIKVIKGIGAGCDKEAIRVLKKSPKWKPGKQRGKAVRVRMSVPINFQLN